MTIVLFTFIAFKGRQIYPCRMQRVTCDPVASFGAITKLMDLSKIISISGKPGLYRVLAQGRQAIIAESLIDGKRIPVHGTMQVSTLDEISMFTVNDDIPLPEVMEKVMENEGGKAEFKPKKASRDELYAKMKEVLPEVDEERVHPSDIKKLFSWYALLLKNGELAKKEEKKKDDTEGKKDEKATKKSSEGKKPAAKKKKAAPKKTAKPKSASKSKGSTVRKGSQRGG